MMSRAAILTHCLQAKAQYILSNIEYRKTNVITGQYYFQDKMGDLKS